MNKQLIEEARDNARLLQLEFDVGFNVQETVANEIDQLCDALEKAVSENRWIPVEERLPAGCGYYLSVVERIAHDELGGNNTRVKIMRWLGADWRYPTHIPKWINEAITETVTHWRPLPQPPTEVKP